MSYFAIITAIHTTLSVIALVTGVAAIIQVYNYGGPPRSTVRWFIALAAATSVTGFLFPFVGITPAVATGIVALAVLAVVAAALRKGRRGSWGKAYAAGIVASEYLLTFVAIAQAFLKIPALHGLAPHGTEPLFVVVQLAVFVMFVTFGVMASSAFHSTAPRGQAAEA